jgi:hypothetical protein
MLALPRRLSGRRVPPLRCLHQLAPHPPWGPARCRRASTMAQAEQLPPCLWSPWPKTHHLLLLLHRPSPSRTRRCRRRCRCWCSPGSVGGGRDALLLLLRTLQIVRLAALLTPPLFCLIGIRLRLHLPLLLVICGVRVGCGGIRAKGARLHLRLPTPQMSRTDP